MLCTGIFIGYFASFIEFRWLLTQNWSVGLLRDWVLIFIVAATLYGVGIFLPLYKLVKSRGNVYIVQHDTLGVTISARQELKRRGSWPLAYTRGIHKRYNPNLIAA